MKGPKTSMLAELAVVFIGVFIALAADSWWGDQQERTRLRSNLEALAMDLQTARFELGSAIAVDSATVVRASAVSAGLRSQDTAPSEVVAAVDSLLVIRLGTVPDGTLRLIIESGDVRLIEDADVRSTLVHGLAHLERNDRINLGLAAEARALMAAIWLARTEAITNGLAWPEAAIGNAHVISATEILEDRVGNIMNILRSSLATVDEMAAGVQGVLGTEFARR